MPRIQRPQADANFVMTGSGGIVEVQGTAEQRAFSQAQFAQLMALAKRGIAELVRAEAHRRLMGATLRRGTRLVVASHNDGKVREIGDLVAPFGVEAVSAGELGLPEPEETGYTFEDNAETQGGGRGASLRLPALADDSGLEVEALGGAPGIYSARWAGAARISASPWSACTRGRWLPRAEDSSANFRARSRSPGRTASRRSSKARWTAAHLAAARHPRFRL